MIRRNSQVVQNKTITSVVRKHQLYRLAKIVVLVNLLNLITGCSVWGFSDDLNTVDLTASELKKETLSIVNKGELATSETVRTLLRRAADRDEVSALQNLMQLEQAITQRPAFAGNETFLLIDGPHTYDAMFQQMDAAEHHVHMESFIFADDKIGQQFAQHMLAASARGVSVRLIFDGLANTSTDDAFFDKLRDGGVQVRKYNSPDVLEDPRIWEINNRNHRKLLIVDGKEVFVGGVNVTSVYASSSSSRPGPEKGMKNSWRDTHLRISGPVTPSYQRLFMENWNQSGEPVELTPDYFTPSSHQGPHIVRAIASEGGDGGEYEVYRVYLSAIREARERLWLTHAYFAPNEEMLEAIVDAAKRGVDVRLMVPGFIDFDMIFYATRSNYHALLEAGVRIFERNDALLHSKTAVVDGLWATVGSANLDMRSFLHNDEINATIVGKRFGKEMEDLFVADAKLAKEISLQSWKERPLTEKIRERFSRVFNYWL